MFLAILANHFAGSLVHPRLAFAQVSLVCLFIAAIIPDLDYVFYDLVGHHTITHSITFWSMVYLPLFLRWRVKVLPYYIATLSHLLGDFILGNPPLFYGISDMRFGLFFDYALANLNPDQFLLARSLLDLSIVIGPLIMCSWFSALRFKFSSDREVRIALPILVVLVVAILVSSQIHDMVFPVGGNHDWPVFIAAYLILAISHALVLLVIIVEARRYARKDADFIKSR